MDTNWGNSDSPVDSSNADKWVKNLSDRPLSKPEVNIFAKGCIFAVVPENVFRKALVELTKDNNIGARG